MIPWGWSCYLLFVRVLPPKAVEVVRRLCGMEMFESYAQRTHNRPHFLINENHFLMLYYSFQQQKWPFKGSGITQKIKPSKRVFIVEWGLKWFWFGKSSNIDFHKVFGMDCKIIFFKQRFVKQTKISSVAYQINICRYFTFK